MNCNCKNCECDSQLKEYNYIYHEYDNDGDLPIRVCDYLVRVYDSRTELYGDKVLCDVIQITDDTINISFNQEVETKSLLGVNVERVSPKMFDIVADSLMNTAKIVTSYSDCKKKAQEN